jgi:uncharacterized protein
MTDKPRQIIIIPGDTWRLLSELEGDCACASPLAAWEPTQTAPHGSYQLTKQTVAQPVDENWSIWLAPEGRQPVLVNRESSAFLVWLKQPRTGAAIAEYAPEAQAALQVLSESGLLTSPETLPLQLAEPTLTTWLHLTDRCNLRCAYCYLPHAREDMGLETGQKVIREIFGRAKQAGFREVKLKYAGGEPLLVLDRLAQLHQFAQEQARQTSLGLRGVLLTNATLLDEAALSVIRKHDLRLSISLDGLEDAHDRQRFDVGGKGTFEKVQQAIRLALAWEMRPHISVTLTSLNKDDLPGLLDWILAHDLTFHINWYRPNPLAANHPELTLSNADIVDAMGKVLRHLKAKLPDRNLLASLADRANLAFGHLTPCGVDQSYLVFDQAGREAQCHMAMRSSVRLQNLPVLQKECAACEWKFWCAGGCPVINHQAKGRFDTKSPLCEAYKTLLPEVLRLEGLRLLKYRQARITQ